MCLLQKKKKKSHFSRAGGTSEICNAALSMHHRWQFCSVIFSKVPPGTSARLWRGCACDIAASRQNYATSPSKCHRCLLLVFFLSTLSAIFSPLLPWGGLPLDLPLTLPLFAECFCAVETNLFVTLLSAVQRSYGRPGDAAPGQDRGMEEDG